MVVVRVRLAQCLARAVYLREEGEAGEKVINIWLPAGSGFEDSVPYKEEYACNDKENPIQQLFGIEALLDYLDIPALDMGPASPERPRYVEQASSASPWRGRGSYGEGRGHTARPKISGARHTEGKGSSCHSGSGVTGIRRRLIKSHHHRHMIIWESHHHW